MRVVYMLLLVLPLLTGEAHSASQVLSFEEIDAALKDTQFEPATAPLSAPAPNRPSALGNIIGGLLSAAIVCAIVAAPRTWRNRRTIIARLRGGIKNRARMIYYSTKMRLFVVSYLLWVLVLASTNSFAFENSFHIHYADDIERFQLLAVVPPGLVIFALIAYGWALRPRSSKS